jgi:MFS transporter, OFA family, oxalate/formate antiporter
MKCFWNYGPNWLAYLGGVETLSLLKITEHKEQQHALWRWFANDVPWNPGRFPFFYGWIIVVGATVGTLFTIPGQTMGFSVFTDILMEELGLSRVTLSLAYCLGTVASGLTLPWMGRLTDRWGERRMTVIASLVTGCVLFYLSLCTGLYRQLAALSPASWHGSIAFVCIGTGFYLIRVAAQGVLSMTCRNVIGTWFDTRRGMALALSGIFVSFGFSMAPRWLHACVERYGHAGAWQLMGGLTILVMVPLGWLIFRDRPEDCGLVMDGSPGKPSKVSNRDMHIHHDFTLHETLRTFSFWVFNLSFAFYALFATAFTFHILSIGSEFFLSRERILSLFMPIALVSVCTNFLFGMINVRLRLKYLLVVMNLGALSAVLGLYHLSSFWGVFAYVVGNGLAGGGFVNLSGIIWPRFFGRRFLGAISGVNMSTMVIASGLGPLLFGWSEQWTGSYRPALLVSMCVPASLMCLSLWADNPQRILGMGETK